VYRRETGPISEAISAWKVCVAGDCGCVNVANLIVTCTNQPTSISCSMHSFLPRFGSSPFLRRSVVTILSKCRVQ